jgi:hypothetical protein
MHPRADAPSHPGRGKKGRKQASFAGSVPKVRKETSQREFDRDPSPSSLFLSVERTSQQSIDYEAA